MSGTFKIRDGRRLSFPKGCSSMKEAIAVVGREKVALPASGDQTVMVIGSSQRFYRAPTSGVLAIMGAGCTLYVFRALDEGTENAERLVVFDGGVRLDDSLRGRSWHILSLSEWFTTAYSRRVVGFFADRQQAGTDLCPRGTVVRRALNQPAQWAVAEVFADFRDGGELIGTLIHDPRVRDVLGTPSGTLITEYLQTWEGDPVPVADVLPLSDPLRVEKNYGLEGIVANSGGVFLIFVAKLGPWSARIAGKQVTFDDWSTASSRNKKGRFRL